MRSRLSIFVVVIVVLVVIFGSFFLLQQKNLPRKSNSIDTTATNIPPTILPSQSEGVIEKSNIIVTSLKPNGKVSLPFVIKGEARVFENQFNYRVRDKNGKVLTEGSATSDSRDAGQFGAFTITISSLVVQKGTNGTIEVFDYSPKDGSELDKVSVPVWFE